MEKVQVVIAYGYNYLNGRNVCPDWQTAFGRLDRRGVHGCD